MNLAFIGGESTIIVLIIVLVVVFGGSQLPKIARNVGSAGKEFRKAQAEAEQEEAAKAAREKLVVPPAVAPTAVAPTAVASAPPVGAMPDDRVTLSKAELEALLNERESRAKGQASN